MQVLHSGMIKQCLALSNRLAVKYLVKLLAVDKKNLILPAFYQFDQCGLCFGIILGQEKILTQEKHFKHIMC